MLMDQMDLAPELVRVPPPDMCKDSDHWAFHHQYECKLDEHTHPQGSAENHPGTLLGLEELQELHLEVVLVQEVQEVHPCTRKGRRY